MAARDNDNILDNSLVAGDLVPGDLIDDGDGVIAASDNSEKFANFSNNDTPSLNLMGDALEPMVLTMDDLFPDENGEVVISTEDGLAISLITSGLPASTGIVDEHVTAAGVDVSGLHYHTFDSGLTVYFDSDSLVEFTTGMV